MLSDEEKKAIEYLKIYIKRDVMYENRHYKQIEIILNLIEKQSKEIQELNYIKRSFDYCVEQENKKWKDKIKAKIEEKFLEAKGLYERGVQPQAQYTMKLLRDLEKSLLEKE